MLGTSWYNNTTHRHVEVMMANRRKGRLRTHFVRKRIQDAERILGVRNRKSSEALEEEVEGGQGSVRAIG